MFAIKNSAKLTPFFSRVNIKSVKFSSLTPDSRDFNTEMLILIPILKSYTDYTLYKGELQRKKAISAGPAFACFAKYC